MPSVLLIIRTYALFTDSSGHSIGDENINVRWSTAIVVSHPHYSSLFESSGSYYICGYIVGQATGGGTHTHTYFHPHRHSHTLFEMSEGQELYPGQLFLEPIEMSCPRGREVGPIIYSLYE